MEIKNVLSENLSHAGLKAKASSKRQYVEILDSANLIKFLRIIEFGKLLAGTRFSLRLYFRF